jgi:hypothetical protein
MDYVLDILLCFLVLALLGGANGGQALGGVIQAFDPPTPRDIEFRRAGGGVGMILLAGIIAWHADELIAFGFWDRVGPASLQVIGGLWSGTAKQLSSYVWMPVAGLVLMIGLVAIGGLRLLIGWHRSYGPRDMLAAAKTLVWGSIFAALLAGSWTGAPWAFLHHDWSIIPRINAVLPSFYLWVTAKAATRLFLELRGTGAGNAVKLVKEHIEEQSVQWQSGSPRQF